MIVREMWLTGFDAPCLHTMYSDKPMQGHGLMQAIAVMLEEHGIACDLLHGSDWKKAVGDGKKTLFALPALQEHVLEQEDGKTRWNQVVTELSRVLMNAPAFTLRAACRRFAFGYLHFVSVVSPPARRLGSKQSGMTAR